MYTCNSPPSLASQLREFHLVDDELVGILTRPGGGSPLPKEDAEAFVKKHDTNGDGKLNFDEFSKVIATNEGFRGDVIKGFEQAQVDQLTERRLR